MKIGMTNWKLTLHMGLTDFCLAMDSSHLKKSMMKFLAHFIHATEIHLKFQHQNTIFKFRLYNKFAFLYVWDVTI